MIGYLQSQDRIRDRLKIGPEEGRLSVPSDTEVLQLPLIGSFSFIAGHRVLFYRWNGYLRLRFGDGDPFALDKSIVRWSHQEGIATFVLMQTDGEVFSKTYPVSRELLSLDNDPTSFVEADHFDLFLFVKNVLSDPERSSRIFQSS